MRERQPDMQRHQAGLGAGADQRQDQDQCGERCRGMRGAHRVETVAAVGTGEQAECQEQRERAETRHHQIDVAGVHIVAFAMVRHDQRPGRQRHELPGHQEREGIVREHHEIHAGEERRIERQHALRRRFVPSIAQGKQAGGRRAEVHHREKERRQRIESKMRAEPRQPERQCHADGRRSAEQVSDAGEQRGQCDHEAYAIDDRGGGRRPAERHRDGCKGKPCGNARQGEHHRHDAVPLSRTPRPPPELTAFSVISSMPAISSAETSFINESTLPRMTPSLASMRWMVGSDNPHRSASLRWSIPRSAREARSCAAEIMLNASIVMYLTSIIGVGSAMSIPAPRAQMGARISSAGRDPAVAGQEIGNEIKALIALETQLEAVRGRVHLGDLGLLAKLCAMALRGAHRGLHAAFLIGDFAAALVADHVLGGAHGAA